MELRDLALGQLNGMFNQGAEFHRLFGQSGDDRVACGNVSRGASPGTQASALPPSMTATGSKRHDLLPMRAKRTGNGVCRIESRIPTNSKGLASLHVNGALTLHAT
jgi:hypothetical protein